MARGKIKAHSNTFLPLKLYVVTVHAVTVPKTNTNIETPKTKITEEIM